MSGKLLIICAPSGAGKTTIVRHLLEKVAGLEFSVSATSRPQRPNEINGIDYYFVDSETFEAKIKANEFLEWEEVYPGRYYGTLRSEIDRIWNRGNNVIFDVDVEGGLNIKRQFGDKALMIFIKPPSIEHLRERLMGRNTETTESLETRVSKADKEMEYAVHADYILTNDNLHDCLPEAERIARRFLES